MRLSISLRTTYGRSTLERFFGYFRDILRSRFRSLFRIEGSSSSPKTAISSWTSWQATLKPEAKVGVAGPRFAPIFIERVWLAAPKGGKQIRPQKLDARNVNIARPRKCPVRFAWCETLAPLGESPRNRSALIERHINAGYQARSWA